MKTNARTSERGQAMLLIMLAVIGLLGFSALAIDLGWTLSERRQAQNAVDGAAYAAGMAALNPSAGVTPQDAAKAQVEEFGYEVTQVTVNRPPVSGPYQGDNSYIQVFVNTEVQPVFSHFVFNGLQKITTEAVVRVSGSTSFSHGNAVHATAESGNGIVFNGNANLHVYSGSVYALSNISMSNNTTVKLDDGQMQAHGTVSNPTKSDPDALDGSDGVPALIIPPIDPPYCDKSKLGSKNESTKTLSPGYFSSGPDIHNGNWTMQPGLYCIDGGFKFNGGKLTGTDVMIVMLSGSFELTGNGSLNLTRPSAPDSTLGIPWGGMLLYVKPGVDLKITGTSDQLISGTIYAPDSFCDIGGSSDTFAIRANIICHDFKFHDQNTNIYYEADENFQVAPTIELVQ